MKLVSDAYKELGKTFTNIGQGIVIAILTGMASKGTYLALAWSNWNSWWYSRNLSRNLFNPKGTLQTEARGETIMINFLIGVAFILLVGFAFILYDRYQDRKSQQ
jgi:hypothetical protein